jgi:hypothetical protein
VIEVTPLKIGEIPKVLQTLRGVTMHGDAEGNIDVLELLAGPHGEAALDAVAFAARKPRAWLDDLPADEALDLAFKVIEVNADFFVRAVLPRIEAGMKAIMERLGTGQTPASA